MLLADVVATSEAIAATRARSVKVEALAGLLARVEPDEIEPVVGFLSGEVRQGRIGIGWATVASIDAHAVGRPRRSPWPAWTPPSTRLATTAGPGSTERRAGLLRSLFEQATAEEGRFLGRLLTGELRQGALEGLMTDAIAKAAAVPAAAVRRALMLGGELGPTARAALLGGSAALEAVQLQVLRPLRPMLASTAESVAEALATVGGAASVEWKLDGARIQVHRAGDEVRVFTRNLNDVTSRLPEVVEVVRGLPAERLVLDGETLTMAEDGRPRAFQDTMSRFGADAARIDLLRPFFFDALHVDGLDLVDLPLVDRLVMLERVAGPWRIPSVITSDPEVGAAFADGALAEGHEGVMVKAASSRYEAGRRGKAWLKVKPVRTLDLVVLGAEWGHGRRHGLAVQPAPRRPRSRRRVRDGGQDVQGPHRCAAGVADRALPRARGAQGRHRRVRAAGAGRGDRPRRRAGVAPLPRRRRPALRPRGALPLRQGPGGGRHHRDGAGPPARRRLGP